MLFRFHICNYKKLPLGWDWCERIWIIYGFMIPLFLSAWLPKIIDIILCQKTEANYFVLFSTNTQWYVYSIRRVIIVLCHTSKNMSNVSPFTHLFNSLRLKVHTKANTQICPHYVMLFMTHPCIKYPQKP